MAPVATRSMMAKEIMQRDPVVARSGDTLRDALDLMTENHVTGLPVMDSQGRCVGLVSSSDILNYELDHSEFTHEANQDVARHFNMDLQRWESVRITSFALEEFAEVHVEQGTCQFAVFRGAIPARGGQVHVGQIISAERERCHLLDRETDVLDRVAVGGHTDDPRPGPASRPQESICIHSHTIRFALG